MRALLLEDDEATRTLYRECIECAGHEVLACGTIKEALDVLRTNEVDLLVIDLLIGDTNSLGLAQYAGYAAPLADIILVTGSQRFAKGEVLSEYPGINWVLRKPLPVSDLEAFVSHAEYRMEKRAQQMVGVS